VLCDFRSTHNIRYDHANKEIANVQLDLEKRVARDGFANFSYQKLSGDIGSIYSVGMRFNFKFAQVGMNARQTRHGLSTYQSASGSIMRDDKLGKTMGSYLSTVGRGGLVVVPFIDVNGNGKKDKGEPKANGLKLTIKGGQIDKNNKDTVIRITGLEAYNDYLVECNKGSFDNIAWRIVKPNIQVTVEPNHFKLIEVPVTVMGEVSGTVTLNKWGETTGIGRMYVNVYKNDTVLVARTLTEPDGYFSYLGLPPGSYKAAIDTAQMRRLNFCCPQIHTFSVNSSLEGDIAGGVDFNITSNEPMPEPPPAPVVIPQEIPLQVVIDGSADIIPANKSVKASAKPTNYLAPKTPGKIEKKPVSNKKPISAVPAKKGTPVTRQVLQKNAVEMRVSNHEKQPTAKKLKHTTQSKTRRYASPAYQPAGTVIVPAANDLNKIRKESEKALKQGGKARANFYSKWF